MKTWGILLAGGIGERFEDPTGIPKALRNLGGVPMYVHPLRAMESAAQIEGIALVVPVNWQAYAMEKTIGEATRAVVQITPGGETRGASVRAGLAVVPDAAESIVVHDAARPLASAALFGGVLHALSGVDGAICAIPMRDTVKRVDGSGLVAETVAREELWRVQTPQAFQAGALRAAHEWAARERIDATDDAALIELRGGKIVVVAGDEQNLKVTTQAELEIAEAMLARGKLVEP